MRPFWKSLVLLPVVAAAILAGCEAGDRPSSALPTSPSEPQQILGGLLGGNKASYTLVKDPLLGEETESLSVSALIGVGGGNLTLLGHTLTVPAGAVSEPTLFTLTVLPTGYVEVDLTATVSTLLGVIDVGAAGFDKPVPISLTYSRATNVKDPKKLIVVHAKGLVGYTDLVPLRSRVDTKAETVTAELEHFSRYMLAYP